MSGEVLDTRIVYDTYELLRDLASVTRRAGDEDKSPVARTVMERSGRIEELAGVLREAWLNGLATGSRAPAVTGSRAPVEPVCIYCKEDLEESVDEPPNLDELAEQRRLEQRLAMIKAGQW
jgi:hypothetical protein